MDGHVMPSNGFDIEGLPRSGGFCWVDGNDWRRETRRLVVYLRHLELVRDLFVQGTLVINTQMVGCCAR